MVGITYGRLALEQFGYPRDYCHCDSFPAGNPRCIDSYRSIGRKNESKESLLSPERLELVAEEIGAAVQDLAKNQFGALIVLENRVGLRNYADTGELLNARISSRLLRALFFPNSALHDGAVILNSQRIVAAGCILPLPAITSEQDSGYGMRHRAAKALAAESDAMVIVVSEETGYISIAYRTSLRRKLSVKEVEEEIKRHWHDLFEGDSSKK